MASFDKELSKTDINDMLVIPTHFMSNLPAIDGGTINLTVDAYGEQKTFGYSIRRDGNRRPALKGGWLKFVRDKGLRIGDKVTFECVAGFPHYKIRTLRRMDLFGEEIWGDIQ